MSSLGLVEFPVRQADFSSHLPNGPVWFKISMLSVTIDWALGLFKVVSGRYNWNMQVAHRASWGCWFLLSSGKRWLPAGFGQETIRWSLFSIPWHKVLSKATKTESACQIPAVSEWLFLSDFENCNEPYLVWTPSIPSPGLFDWLSSMCKRGFRVFDKHQQFEWSIRWAKHVVVVIPMALGRNIRPQFTWFFCSSFCCANICSFSLSTRRFRAAWSICS